MTSCTSIDVADQARDYISEFYRMRRCILPSVQIPFYYSFTSDKTPKEVFLVADFTEWAEHPIPMRKMGNRFYVSIPLKKGRYFYKYRFEGYLRVDFLWMGNGVFEKKIMYIKTVKDVKIMLLLFQKVQISPSQKFQQT